jgi:DNA-binding transcriptional MerR regulator
MEKIKQELFTISEVAKLLDLKVYTIRDRCKAFLIKYSKNDKGLQSLTLKDIEKIKEVQELYNKGEKYSEINMAISNKEINEVEVVEANTKDRISNTPLLQTPEEFLNKIANNPEIIDKFRELLEIREKEKELFSSISLALI